MMNWSTTISRLFLLVTVVLTGALLGCRTAPEESATVEITDDSPTAYLEGVLDIMESNSLFQYRADWESVRAEALAAAAGAETTADVYPAIELALELIGDEHGRLYTAEAWVEFNASSGEDYAEPAGELIDGNVGYLSVQTFDTRDDVSTTVYATRLQELIRDLDQQGACGWVVDLRENRGGNMWPMLAGLGPLTGTTCVGHFIDANGEGQAWCYENGQAQLDTGEMLGVRQEMAATFELNYFTEIRTPPVAVLTGPDTASSGEAMVIAFRERENARSFGQVTAGRTSSPFPFELPDGAVLALSTEWMADRNRDTFEAPIFPDEEVPLTPGEVPEEALAWLQNQPACGAP